MVSYFWLEWIIRLFLLFKSISLFFCFIFTSYFWKCFTSKPSDAVYNPALYLFLLGCITLTRSDPPRLFLQVNWFFLDFLRPSFWNILLCFAKSNLTSRSTSACFWVTVLFWCRAPQTKNLGKTQLVILCDKKDDWERNFRMENI